MNDLDLTARQTLDIDPPAQLERSAMQLLATVTLSRTGNVELGAFLQVLGAVVSEAALSQARTERMVAAIQKYLSPPAPPPPPKV